MVLVLESVPLVADGSLFLTRCFSLYLFTLISAVSEPEKNADNIRSITRITKRLSIDKELIFN